MRYFDHKILVVLTLASIYFFELRCDNSILAEINTSLSSLANYSEIIKQTQKEEPLSEMTWNEWYEKCNKLPFGRNPKIGFNNYTNKAIEWDELEKVIEKFITVNTRILTQPDTWLEDAPQKSDSFFTHQDSPLDPIQPFVQKLIVDSGTRIGFHGDFHGDVHSMVKYIQRLNDDKYMDGFKIIAPNFYLVFLGDYEDRGLYGAEVWYTLMRLKIANPEKVIIVRGNHEDKTLDYKYGFAEEFLTKFDPEFLQALKKTPIFVRELHNSKSKKINKFFRIFDFLPPALYLGSGTDNLKNYLLCVHGGQEEKFDSENLLTSNRKLIYEWLKFKDNTDENPSPTSLSEIGFMWNDFEIDPNEPTTEQEGRGYMWNKEDTKNYFNTYSNKQAGYKLKGIFRAHQHGIHDLMRAMIEGNGVAKLWPDETNEGKDLWNGIICTFLVGPDTAYGRDLGYDFDGFGILTTAEEFKDWKFEIKKNENIVPKSFEAIAT